MDNISSVIGNKSDLICIKCKKKRKMRMSAYCPKCKIDHEKQINRTERG